MEISEKLKQRFCKDMNISIQLYRSPFFESRIELMGYKREFDQFVSFVSETFRNEEEYFSYYNNLKDKIIDFIKNSEAYKALQSDADVCNKKSFNLRQGDTYKDSCVGRSFLSVDMRKANFSALVKYGKECGKEFFESYDYEKFVKQFTPYEYFAKSKYIRQVVFGNCNPKRQIAYETLLMSNLLKLVTDSSNLTGLTMNDVYSLNSDEIIFDVTEKDGKEIANRLGTFVSCLKDYDFPLKIEAFQIGKFQGTKAYAKLFDDGTYELKCVNPYEAPFVYRYMKKQVPLKTDKFFLYEGKLARFEEVPCIELVTDVRQIKDAEKDTEEKDEELS